MQSSQDHISWREVQNKSFSHTHTHTPTHQLDQKISTLLRSRDINSTGFHIETAPVDDIEGCNGKDNNRKNLQYVTVVVACSQRSDPICMLHGTLSY